MKAFITILVLAVVIVGIILLTKNKSATLEVVNPGDESAMVEDTTTSSDDTMMEEDTTAMSPTTYTVSYTSAGFSPSPLTIHAGDTVTFVNNTSSTMWVASNPHPVHTDYSVFDAKKSYAPGESYSFTFTEAGTYGYHDHTHASMLGEVVVE